MSVADAAYDTLTRAAALNLSNMENLEWLSGQPLLLDEKNPALIGPVINSKRQLWSVGAYIGMVIENVFGISTTADGIALKPFITARLRREAFGKVGRISLNSFALHGKRISVTIHLPKATDANGYYPVRSVALNGVAAGVNIAWDKLADGSVIDIRLGKLQSGAQEIRRVKANPFEQAASVFAPHDPTAPKLSSSATMTIGARQDGVVYNIYRDGQLAAARLAAGEWTDRQGGAHGCYAVEAQFVMSGNRSHHSPPACRGNAVEVPASEPRLKKWGVPSDTFATRAIPITEEGNYVVQLRYHNGANQINLGISGGVKWLSLKDKDGRVVAAGVVQLPHTKQEQANAPLTYSTPLSARLAAGSVTVELSDFYNMSYLQANRSFTGAGGVNGASNIVDLHAVRILRIN